MRYQLLPHLYTAFHQANKQGTPVARPLWFAYPQDPATHAIDDQWLFGDVLVTPILDEVCTAVALATHMYRQSSRDMCCTATRTYQHQALYKILFWQSNS
jgi:hypothetical protein